MVGRERRETITERKKDRKKGLREYTRNLRKFEDMKKKPIT